MSQLYHVELKGSVVETIHLKDEVKHKLELTPLLPEEDMKALLRKNLEKKGYQSKDGQIWKKTTEEGIEVVFDLDELQVSASLEEVKEVQQEIQVKGSAYDDKKQARKQAQLELERQKERASERIQKKGQDQQKKLTQTLEESEPERLLEINTLLQEVYAEALKEKAKSLGDITEIHESTSLNGEYELIIKINH